MSSEELIQKYIRDKYSLNNEELDSLQKILVENFDLVKEIKDSWLMDEYLSRVLASDRQMFPKQVLKRVAELHNEDDSVITMEAIIAESAKSELSKSGRYRKSQSGKSSSSRSKSNRHRNSKLHISASKNNNSANIVMVIAAIFIGIVGLVWLTNKKSLPAQIEKNTSAETYVKINIENDLPKVDSLLGEITFVRNGVKFILKKNSLLKENDEIVLSKGESLELVYTDGTKIAVEENSVLEIKSSSNKALKLKEGKLVGVVSKQKVALNCFTENAEIKVLGTVFSLSYNQNKSFKGIEGESELVVEEGKIEMTSLTSRESILVEAQEYAVLNAKTFLKYPKPKRKIVCDFNQNTLPKGMKWVKKNSAMIANNRLEIKNGSINLLLDLKGWAPPFKVSYSFIAKPSDAKGPLELRASSLWEDTVYGIYAAGVGLDLPHGGEVNIDIVIDEENYFYSNCRYGLPGKEEKSSFMRVFYAEPASLNQGLLFNLGGNINIEYLTVEEIKVSEVADIEEAKSIFKSLPRNKEKKEIIYDKFPLIINGKTLYLKQIIVSGANVKL